MNLYINDNLEEVPQEITTIAKLVAFKHIPNQGTAISLNDKLIKQNNWEITKLKDFDSITIISAAFGG